MRCWNGNEARAPRGRKSGFTVVELMVSVVVAAVAVLVTLVLANGMTQQLRGQKQATTAQDNARVAIDEITRTLRGAGSGADYSSGQPRFVYAGPFTIALNGNMQPLDDPAGTGEPVAIDASLANPSVPLADGDSYTPPMTYGTGAETIVLTFDSNRDGILDASDASDDAEEESDNPNDFVLKQFVYGKSGGENQVNATGLAVLRGPSSATDTDVAPLFSYWIDDDNDPSTSPVLHGDTSGDGKLSPDEAVAAGPVTSAQIGLIDRIEVTATAESEKPAHGSEYRQAVLRSSVSFRNRSTTASRVTGIVFHDLDHDGVRDPGELGIRDVIIRCSNNTKTKTDVDGFYMLVLNPGVYTITEVDPPSYTSTTPNQVPVHPTPGDYVRVDFGDLSSLGVGRIVGTVFSDWNANSVLDTGERGIRGVKVFLDTGQSTLTDSRGYYAFEMPLQDYVITEVDSAGYVSVTPNVVDVTLDTAGDSVVTNFADFPVLYSGTVHGIVYRDDDNDGVFKKGEPGIANVTMTLDGGEVTTTDTKGEFKFTVVPGLHDVEETDPPGYTSSTVNLVHVTVSAQQTVEVRFGDIAQQDISFQEITLGNTERALSINSLDLGEDNKLDQDIVLGTHYVGGRNDILAWWNKRVNSSTPNSALFGSTADYARVIAADVNALAVPDLNGDGRGDVISALGTASNNVAVWVTQGALITKGQMPLVPSALYTASGAQSVSDLVTGAFDGNSATDFVIGTVTAPYTGKVEVWHGGGSGFSRSTNDIFDNVPGGTSNWGQIVCLAKADFDRNGQDDLVVGARTSDSASRVYVLLNRSGATARFDLQAQINIAGSITDVLALDMKEDDLADIDLVVGVETYSTAGRVEVWHNRGDNHFGQGDTPEQVPDDTAEISGSPLSLSAALLDNDIFPDLVVGTRSALYSGQVLVYRAYGYLPSTPLVASSTNVGEVITVTNADYNKDGAPDVAVGTRTSATSGKVVIYFNQRPLI